MAGAPDVDKELESSVYDAPAARLHEIFLALRRQGFTKAQSESMVCELVEEEFRQ